MEPADLALSRDMIVVLGLVGFTMAMFMTDRIRADATALVVLVALGLFGIVPASRLFDGFAGNAVISLMATMVLAAGLDRTGALNRVAQNLLRWSNGLESRLLLIASGVAAGLSAFMQNPAVTALMLPVASRLAGRTGISLSRLLLPIAAAVLMGGSLTMIGSSPLILLNDLLVAANRHLPPGVDALQPLPLFAPLPIGIALVLLSLVYWHFGARRWLADDALKGVAPARTDSYFAKAYGIEGELWELTLTPDSPLVGMAVGEAESQPGTPLFLALATGGDARLAPPADERLWVGSVIGVMGPAQAIQDYAQKNLLRVSGRLRQFADLFNPARAGISEAVVPPTSSFVGRRPEELRLRKRAGISLLAINRDNQVWRENLRRIPLKAGDLLVFHSVWTDLAQAAESRDFVVVTDYPKDEQRPHKLGWAVSIFVATMALAFSTLVPVPLALMAGAAALLVTGVLDMDEAYAAISWRSVFLMACLIPLGWAMDATGAANWVAQHTLARLGPDTPLWALQFALGLLTALFALVIGNVGATVIMVPMAINLALAADGSPGAFALVAALAATNNFVSASNPVLAMVAGPAGYTGRDFWRTGWPLTLAYLVVTVGMVHLIEPWIAR
ncbi:MAG: SLC13 family permease [Lysobacteraceae bacterium]|jgi:di/tricarboxylate transporter|nr:SLC13 family permease [Xanthomonadaceae bacterium]MCZ8319053.1 SLC13 family permease [Silanimonas sp.]